MIQIKQKMLCNKVPNMMNLKDLNKNSPVNLQTKFNVINVRIKETLKSCKKTISKKSRIKEIERMISNVKLKGWRKNMIKL